MFVSVSLLDDEVLLRTGTVTYTSLYSNHLARWLAKIKHSTCLLNEKTCWVNLENPELHLVLGEGERVVSGDWKLEDNGVKNKNNAH